MIKLFAHRGFVTGNISQNSIASLKQAYDFGFRAIEFDIWFVKEKLVLKHDAPKDEEIESLPNFGDYFCFKNEMIYWMDFKNLDEKNSDKALRLVKKELDKALINMDKVYFAPFILDYQNAKKVFLKIREIFGEKANLVAVCEELENKKDEQNLRDFLTENKIKFLSIFYKIIDKNFIEKFSDIEIFAWTVNDLNSLKELEKIGVRNFATDKITPV
jgi:glycerophosphoryl diester phosphodiesterase